MAKQAGFSLLEILIGLALLAGIGALVAGRVFQNLHEGNVRTTEIQMQNLARSLKDYRRHCGAYPSTEQGLQALIQKPASGRKCQRYQPGGYLEGGDIPVDPWGNEYYYESDGRTFNIISFGNDGEPGGDDEATDIYFDKDQKDETS